MRLEVGDTKALSRRAIIKVDGNVIEKCTIADTDLGLVVRFVTDENGNIVVDGDHARKETIHGNVEIYDPDISDTVPVAVGNGV